MIERYLLYHIGHHLYTIGQRARLDGQSGAWFVVGKDSSNNTVTVVSVVD